jgi:hypothetical protein
MNRLEKILRFVLFFLFLILITGTGCAVKKDPWSKKRSKSSHVNTSQLGRNRYYFSVGYQKKLQKSVKKKSY